MTDSLKKSNAKIYGLDNFRPRTHEVLGRAYNTSFYFLQSQDKLDKPLAMGGFRVTQNAGDPYSRMNYSCKGPNQLSSLVFTNTFSNKDGVHSTCDDTGVEPSSCNVKYVYDSSNFTRYSKERAMLRNRVNEF